MEKKSFLGMLIVFTLLAMFKLEAQEPAEKMVFKVVEKMPEFPGGTDALKTFISQNVKYPSEAVRDSITGKVFVSFVVDSMGKVTDTKIERSVHSLLDEEALRVINELPDWKPGTQRGKAVNVVFTVPIQFALK